MQGTAPVIINNHADFSTNLYLEMKLHGPHCSLNHWDISQMDDLSAVFRETQFDGNISEWDVSHVENMSYMFDGSPYTGQHGSIAGWNVSNVLSMEGMFYRTPFCGDLSLWRLSPDMAKKDVSLFVTHNSSPNLGQLFLPVSPYSVVDMFDGFPAQMHAWLAAHAKEGRILVHHWDALLVGAVDHRWATPAMVAFAAKLAPVFQGLGLSLAQTSQRLTAQWDCEAFAASKPNESYRLPLLD